MLQSISSLAGIVEAFRLTKPAALLKCVIWNRKGAENPKIKSVPFPTLRYRSTLKISTEEADLNIIQKSN